MLRPTLRLTLKLTPRSLLGLMLSLPLLHLKAK